MKTLHLKILTCFQLKFLKNRAVDLIELDESNFRRGKLEFASLLEKHE